MSTSPRLTYRYAHSVELIVQNEADVSAYRFSAANTLDTAFAGTTTMFEVPQGSSYRSMSLRRKRLGTSIYTLRGITAAMYDPEDFWVAGGALPHDTEAAYLRVEERNVAGVYRPPGPILIVPPPNFFITTRPNLTVHGTAPNVAPTATGNPPAGAMNFVLPRYADTATIGNRGGASLWVSFNPGLPEFEVPSGDTIWMPNSGITAVFIRGEGAAVEFSIYFTVINAEMA